MQLYYKGINKLDNKTWLVYLLKCANNSLYCGITNDLSRRLRQHNGDIKGGAKYTRANAPCQLVYQEVMKDRSEASKREYEIKQMDRSVKLAPDQVKMNTYQRISCEDHSIFELVIMRAQSMKVVIEGKLVRIKPIDLVTQKGTEFLIFVDEYGQKQQFRADLINIQK